MPMAAVNEWSVYGLDILYTFLIQLPFSSPCANHPSPSRFDWSGKSLNVTLHYRVLTSFFQFFPFKTSPVRAISGRDHEPELRASSSIFKYCKSLDHRQRTCTISIEWARGPEHPIRISLVQRQVLLDGNKLISGLSNRSLRSICKYSAPGKWKFPNGPLTGGPWWYQIF